MKGKELREFALECLKAARQADHIVDQDAYRIIAECLIRRANEIDHAIAPICSRPRPRKTHRAM